MFQFIYLVHPKIKLKLLSNPICFSFFLFRFELINFLIIFIREFHLYTFVSVFKTNELAKI